MRVILPDCTAHHNDRVFAASFSHLVIPGKSVQEPNICHEWERDLAALMDIQRRN